MRKEELPGGQQLLDTPQVANLEELSGQSWPNSLGVGKLYSVPVLTRPEGDAHVKAIPVYFRQELAPLYKALGEFLGDKKSIQFNLTGPPGIGKTLTITLVCRMLTSTHGDRRILFINYRSQNKCDIQIFQTGQVRWYQGGVQPENLSTVLEKIMRDENGKIEICVLDGIRNPDKDADCKKVLVYFNSQVGRSTNCKFRRGITITSVSFRDRNVESREGRMPFCLDSWTLKNHTLCFQSMLTGNMIQDLLKKDILDYAAEVMEEEEDCATEVMEEEGDDASNDDDDEEMSKAPFDDGDLGGLEIKDDDDDDDSDDNKAADTATSQNEDAVIEQWLPRYVEHKYFYAGGSARFMYGRAMPQLKTELTVLFGLVSDWDPFASNTLPPGELYAVNSLMQQFKSSEGIPMTAPLSKHVLMIAYEKCESAMIGAVRGIADSTGNPSLQGWAFELEEIDKVKRILKIPAGHPQRHLQTTQRLVLYPQSEATYDGTNLHMPSAPVGLTVIWCLKWNQGCFDMALFFNGQLVTVQFTVAASHSLKLEYVSQLRSALVAHGLDPKKEVVHWFVVKDDVLNVFKHDTPTGTGRGGCKLEFTVSVCKSTAFNFVDGTATNELTSEAATDVEVHSNKTETQNSNKAAKRQKKQ